MDLHCAVPFGWSNLEGGEAGGKRLSNRVDMNLIQASTRLYVNLLAGRDVQTSLDA
jgi:hypothetical protein